MVDFKVIVFQMLLKGGGHAQPSGFAMSLMDDRAVITELLQHEGTFQKQPPKEMPTGTDFLVVLLSSSAHALRNNDCLTSFCSSPGQLSCALYHVVVGSRLSSILRRTVSSVSYVRVCWIGENRLIRS